MQYCVEKELAFHHCCFYQSIAFTFSSVLNYLNPTKVYIVFHQRFYQTFYGVLQLNFKFFWDVKTHIISFDTFSVFQEAAYDNINSFIFLCRPLCEENNSLFTHSEFWTLLFKVDTTLLIYLWWHFQCNKLTRTRFSFTYLRHIFSLKWTIGLRPYFRRLCQFVFC